MLDSLTCWARLSVLLLVSSIGAVGMWLVVSLPAVQAEFSAAESTPPPWHARVPRTRCRQEASNSINISRDPTAPTLDVSGIGR